MKYGLDVSSHQPSDLSGLIRAHSPDFMIVRMYLPDEAPGLQLVSHLQVASCKYNNVDVWPYFWAYRGFNPEKSVDDAVNLCWDTCVDPRKQVLWIDCEDYLSSDPGPNADWLLRAAKEADSHKISLGIYSAPWWWNRADTMNGDEQFHVWPLWVAQGDEQPAPTVFNPFGGWTQCQVKQWSYRYNLDRDVAA